MLRVHCVRTVLAGLLTLIGLTTLAPDVLAAGVLDQQQVLTPDWYLNGDARWAQIITPGTSGWFNEVDLMTACSGCSGTLVLSVYSVSSGLPQAPLASMSVSAANLPASSTPSWQSFVFPTPAHVTAGQPTAIVVDGSGISGGMSLGAHDGNPYPAGQLLELGGALNTWQPSSGQMALSFRTYATSASPPPLNAAPIVSSLSPNSTSTNSGPLSVSITGTGFSASSLATWNGILCDGFSGQFPCSTTFVSPTQLNASLPAGLLTAPTCGRVSVLNPAPGGGTTPPQAFTVLAPLPAGEVTVMNADCTGTTDSTSALVTALQTAAAARTILVIPPGSYVVQPGMFVVKDGVTISGAGATLVSSGIGYNLLDLSGSNIDVEGLTVDGRSQVLHVVEVEKGATDLTLHGVTVQNSGQDPNPTSPDHSAQTVGIRVQGDGHNMLFDTITVQNIVATYSDGTSMIARGLLLDNGGGASTVSKQVTVRNSSFINVGPKDDGDCLVEQGSSDVDAGLVITNDRFDYCHKRAIKLQVGGVVVQNNTIDNPFHGDNAYQFRTETLDPNTGKPTFDMFSAIALRSANMLVSGNTTTGAGSFCQAIEITTAAGAPPAQNLNILGNTLANGAGSETVAPSSFVRSDVAITSLAIRLNSMTNAPDGLYLQASVTNGVISCNTYTGVSTQSVGSAGAEQLCVGPPPAPTLPVQAVGVPALFPPGADWSRLDNGAPVAASIIVSPDSGPGTAINFGYVSQVQQSRARGIAVLGYVHTFGGSRSAADVESDIDAYYSWYGVDGIFFDEVSTNCTSTSLYSGLVAYVRGKGGIARTVLNPSAAPAQCYAGIGDVLVAFDGDAGTYLNSYSEPGWLAGYPSSRVWHLVYGASSEQQMQSVVALSKTRGAGWIYVTSMTAGSQWSALPADPYWSDELTAASHAAPASLSSASPTSLEVQAVNAPAQTIVITGANLTAGSLVQWQAAGGASPVPLTTTFVSPAQLSALVPAGDLMTPGFAELSVTGASGSVPFYVTATSTSVSNVVSASNTTGNTTFTASSAPLATAGSIGASATGTGTITVAQYSADPETSAPTGGANAYFDVHVDSGSSLTALTIVDCDLSATPGSAAYGILQWWTGTTWAVVSDQTPNTPRAGCTTVSISPTSSPAISQLVGTAFAVVVDSTPPVTTATASGTSGKDGWYTSSVQVALSAADNRGGSGVASTLFSLDGATLQAYTALIDVATDGQHVLKFWSVDAAGNTEAAHSLALAIDQTPPTVAYTGNAGSYGVLEQVNITCTAADPPPGSGLASTTCANVHAPAYTFSAVGPNTFSASATDVAGNTAMARTSFTLNVTAANLCTLATAFVKGSARYAALAVLDKQRIDALATKLCQSLASVNSLTPQQKAQLEAVFTAGVLHLQKLGWLSATQANILAGLVCAL